MVDQRESAGAPLESDPEDSSRRPKLIVGIGASAGGITALRQFFAQVPRDAGIAYVVILHLSPDHESRLADVIQAVSVLPVTQVLEQVGIDRDHVYVIPPNRNLVVTDGMLSLSELPSRGQRRAPVDLFFRTLGDVHAARSVSVILSGTGADGTSGFKRVKENGGLTIAQDPETAEYRDMPAAAIATGLVDLVLPAHEMPARIVEYASRVAREQAPEVAALESDAESLREILNLLRLRTGQDFSNYKPGTVMRRVTRRMSVREVSTLTDYTRFLRKHPEESAALMKELLISVTNFFRDREAFEVLGQRIIPQLFAGKHSLDQVRVWCAGCATGEEAYSLAILLAETAASISAPPTIQVFATDLDQQAIAAAREGVYTEAEVADVSEERLQRFFMRLASGYRVRRELRELVLFASHNVIKDPPFSHLDLISCRNLLIYLNRAAQERAIETFHFALRPGKLLFLGLSETPDVRHELFTTSDKSAHIFESRVISSRLPEPLSDITPKPGRLLPRAFDLNPSDRMVPAELHQQLLEQYAPPSIVVNNDDQVVHISPRATRYLRIAGGEPTRDVLHMVRSELQMDLRAALHQASRERISVSVSGVRVRTEDGPFVICLTVRPVSRDGASAPGFFLVTFEEQDATPEPRVELASPADADSRHLDEELTKVRVQLRATVEQYETQVEEAKASNEELQALNEELRSSAEELETSKEELQSVNEELTTVNQELKIKIEELGITNNDIQNFINSTEVAAVFLDRALRVKLATPRVRDIFKLRPSDTGRPLSEITNVLANDTVREDVDAVLERLHVIEREVSTRDNAWFLMRVLPYRTTDNRIDGVVLTFLNITTRREAEARLRASEERLRLVIDTAIDYAIFTMDQTGIVDSWNAGAQRMFGYAAEEIIGRSIDVLFTAEDREAGAPQAELRRAAETGRAHDERWHVRKDGRRLYCSGVTIGFGPTLGFAKIARDLTSHREADNALRAAHAEIEDRVRQRTSALEDEVQEQIAAGEHVTMLLRKVVTAQEDERARVARDLHDQLGQQLTALRLALERQRERMEAGEATPHDLARAIELTAALDTQIDFLAWELRPALLDDLGLAVALPRFLEEWSKHYGIPAEFRLSGFVSGQLSREAEVTFYRVAQEALNNIVKHAHATRLDVMLETRDGACTLLVEDDGVGFDTSDPSLFDGGIGLIGMRERAALIGATLDVESTLGRGTSVFLRCPLRS
jgi:two-component system CheB/CheR fusion protein